MKKDILYPLRCIHGILVEGPGPFLRKRELRKKIREQFRKNPRTMLLLMTPEHGNLGDHAIAWAARELLEKAGIACMEFTQAELIDLHHEGALSVMNGFPIAINGGGNIGTLWPEVEQLMEDIVSENPKSPIAILPNTAVFENTPQGQRAMEQACQVFGNHKNIRIYAREERSFEVLKDRFPGVKLIPDLVLSLSWKNAETIRQGCIFCLRSDCEQTLSEKNRQSLRREAEEIFGEKIQNLDMIAPVSQIPKEQHAEYVKQQMTAFAGAELVVTDRLHAMLFCALTGTPCIVLNSRSPKILGCYQWIRDLSYIRLLDGRSFRQTFENLPKTGRPFEPDCLEPYFRQLQQELGAMTIRR